MTEENSISAEYEADTLRQLVYELRQQVSHLKNTATLPLPEDIEKVAKAICRTRIMETSFPMEVVFSYTERHWKENIEEAKAAIHAMK